MNIQDYIFEQYVTCPICKENLLSLSGSHLHYKHGYEGIREFKIEYNIPFNLPIVSHETRRKMRRHGQKRSEWFKKEVMPVGLLMAKDKKVIVPKEAREHMGRARRGQSWIPEFVQQMKEEGWLDLYDASKKLGLAYNYARKCATDGRLQTVMKKSLRFTTEEWVEEWRVLLERNRPHRYDGLSKAHQWKSNLINQMREEGWLDLNDASKKLGLSFSYIGRCSREGKLKTITEKGLRFTTEEWVEDCRALLQKNRDIYQSGLKKGIEGDR
ncbi:hypothetical protein [Thermoactinomyces sp. DSM 45892]|uniref:hypothetical protein n=1 Tax=Thermoactinomyces sp. DSM 45892 TaxID=1882753 RepID=UPI00089C066A|nr:hypothetical protein [Thermoactinomyces sp. DSM 45892]SDX93221.1 hypothetical protein SAMN05444416_10139 [Thermoactinomyces sp. DSM 45892]